MRHAYALAINAGKKGNHPFGAVLVYQGGVILTAENAVHTENDSSRHAEMFIAIQANRTLTPGVRRESTLYTSAAPCMLCCAAIYYAGIQKIVYGVSHETFGKLTGAYFTDIRCDSIFKACGRALEWIGPILPEEGLDVFRNWPDDPFRTTILKNLKELQGREKMGSPSTAQSQREVPR